MRGKTLLIGLVGIVIGVLLSTAVVFAGSLNPTAGPGSAGSQMYTLQQIWDRINNGAAASKMSAFTEPATGPGSTMKTLDDLYILAGQRSRPAKTGQTTGYASGDDGDLEKGVAWPNPRFTDNGNGTVTDNLTGLIWLKTANCFSLQTWANALSAANTLNSGECGLTDGSAERAWRLPNVREMQSLIDYSRYNFALPSGHPFTNVENAFYWTSTALPGSSAIVWTMYLVDGGIDPVQNVPTNFYRVWPVRGGQ
jgi:hypothetical protein